MTPDDQIMTRRLAGGDVQSLRDLNALFAAVFEDPATYTKQPPDAAYLADLLASSQFIAVSAETEAALVGGLIAYVLPKFEQRRSEIYIYDLAVRAGHRRQGVATQMIAAVQDIAAAIGAWVVFVQADYVDPPAIALYEKLGAREEVLHFDIPPTKTSSFL